MNDEQLLRYSRHILLPQVDLDGQQRLTSSKVLLVGLGGLGSPVALYLAAAGVGQLLLCDHDQVELSNLQRQIIHGMGSLGQSKVDSAIKRIADLNPECLLEGYNEAISEPLLKKIISNKQQPLDLIIDCTDNLDTRLVINEACVRNNIPLVSGAAIRMEGQVSVFLNQGDGPCYQCMFPNTHEKQLSCSEAGVLATTVGIIGTLQAQEVLKLLLGIGKIVDGSLLLMDGLNAEWRTLTISKRADCEICS